jgi:hypothetical protein
MGILTFGREFQTLKTAKGFPSCPFVSFVVYDLSLVMTGYFNSSTSFSFALLISSIFLISPSVSF